jgi:hypothetical protein
MTPIGAAFIGLLGLGGAAGLYLLRAPPAKVPAGLPAVWTLRAPGDLRSVAAALHDAWRARLLGRLAPDEADLEGTRRRRHEACAEGLVVSTGVASPPGPVRLILEERRPGDRPGVRLHAVLTRVGDDVRVELRGASPRLWPLPRKICALASDELGAAVQAVDQA